MLVLIASAILISLLISVYVNSSNNNGGQGESKVVLPAISISTSLTITNEPATPTPTSSTKIYEPEPIEAELRASSTSGESPRSGNGFFDSFNPTTYRAYLRGLSDATLQKKEMTKIKAEHRGQAGLALSAVGLALFGFTGPTTAISARNLYLAHKKLPLVREEIERRGLK